MDGLSRLTEDASVAQEVHMCQVRQQMRAWCFRRRLPTPASDASDKIPHLRYNLRRKMNSRQVKVKEWPENAF